MASLRRVVASRPAATGLCCEDARSGWKATASATGGCSASARTAASATGALRSGRICGFVAGAGASVRRGEKGEWTSPEDSTGSPAPPASIIPGRVIPADQMVPTAGRTTRSACSTPDARR